MGALATGRLEGVAEVRRGKKAGTYRLVPLKQNHTTALVSRSQVITGVIEFNG
jgi:hypothetical protein